MTEATCYEPALIYAGYGWSVVPIKPRGKAPLVSWQEFRRRRAEAGEIAQWFERWPEANVGIVTGSISGVAVLDIDLGRGGEDSLATWQMPHGALPPTPEAVTGGGGRHIYFSMDATALKSTAAVATGIDVRAEGGLVVAPPSRHASGKLYRWTPGRAPEDVPLAPMPGWLSLALLARGYGHGHPLSHWRDLVRRGVKEGERNETIASLCGHLLWHGVDAQVALELLLCWNRERCAPPLDDAEVASVVASITRLHERERRESLW
jgi:hypothetical protein